jgi:hypothetical protein
MGYKASIGYKMLYLQVLMNETATNPSTQQVLLRVSIYMIHERNGQSLDERQHAVEISTITIASRQPHCFLCGYILFLYEDLVRITRATSATTKTTFGLTNTSSSTVGIA